MSQNLPNKLAPADISVKSRLMDIMGTARTLNNHTTHLVEAWFGGQPDQALTTAISNPETIPDVLEDIDHNLRRLSNRLEYLSARI